MSKSRTDIIENITRAVCGPLGKRSLAGAVRKCLAVILELRSDGIGWDQLSQLFQDCGLGTTPEAIRRTVRRAQQRLERPVKSPVLAIDSTLSDAPMSSQTAAMRAAQQQYRPGPGPPQSPAQTVTHKSALPTVLQTGGAHIDTMAKLKELNRS